MESQKQYSWVDPESGERFLCSKEYYESMFKNFSDATPKLSNKFELKPIIYGTSGNINTNNDYEKLWEQSMKR